MKITFSEATATPPPLTTTIELNEIEARRLRALVGRLGYYTYSELVNGDERGAFKSAFPSHTEFFNHVNNLYQGLSSHRRVATPHPQDDRDF